MKKSKTISFSVSTISANRRQQLDRMSENKITRGWRKTSGVIQGENINSSNQCEPQCSPWHGLSTSAWELLCHSRSQKYWRSPLYPKISLILLELVVVEGQAVWSTALMSLLANYPAISVSLPPTCTKREGAAGREGGSINLVNQTMNSPWILWIYIYEQHLALGPPELVSGLCSPQILKVYYVHVNV